MTMRVLQSTADTIEVRVIDEHRPPAPTPYKTLEELFADPHRWTKYAIARDVNGRCTEPDNSKAVCWCLVGGLELIYGELHAQSISLPSAKVSARIGEITIGAWNDSHSYSEVLALVKELSI